MSEDLKMSDSAFAVKQILNDPTASYWLKDALRKSLERDPVDALDDAEVLAKILKDRWNEIQKRELSR